MSMAGRRRVRDAGPLMVRSLIIAAVGATRVCTDSHLPPQLRVYRSAEDLHLQNVRAVASRAQPGATPTPPAVSRTPAVRAPH